jgi:hypothetical protein
MLMNENKLWDFAQVPLPCEDFLKVFIDRYWDKLSILHVSYGSLAFVRLSKPDLHSLSHPPTLPLLLLHLHLGQLCWCKKGAILGIYEITNLWVMGRRFLMWGHHGIMVLRQILHNNHKSCFQPWVLGMFHHFNPKYM